jgi:hypothetical protein
MGRTVKIAPSQLTLAGIWARAIRWASGAGAGRAKEVAKRERRMLGLNSIVVIIWLDWLKSEWMFDGTGKCCWMMMRYFGALRRRLYTCPRYQCQFWSSCPAVLCWSCRQAHDQFHEATDIGKLPRVIHCSLRSSCFRC